MNKRTDGLEMVSPDGHVVFVTLKHIGNSEKWERFHCVCDLIEKGWSLADGTDRAGFFANWRTILAGARRCE